MGYNDLSPLVRDLLVIWIVVLLVPTALVFCLSILYQRKFKAILTNLAFLLVTIGVCLLFLYYQNHPGFAPVSTQGVVAIWLMPGCLTLIAAIEVSENLYIARHRLTRMSIRDALNQLPPACYYLPNGRLLLVNDSMNEISRILFVKTILNGPEFWNKLIHLASTQEMIKMPEGIIIIALPDGRIMHIKQNELKIDGVLVTELLAVDVTNSYEMAVVLQENNERLAAQQKKLLSFGELVTDVTREKEVLSARKKLHDELGSLLVATRHVLSGGEGLSSEALLSLWKDTLSLLKHESEPQKDESYETVWKAAGDVGVNLILVGELPMSPDLKSVVVDTYSECITNLIRHAGGDTITTESTYANGAWTLRFTNNGKVPEKPIKESGGLVNLRLTVEECGGEMKIESSPVFRLTLTLPEEREE